MSHSTLSATEWKINIYRVRDSSLQQQILSAFRHAARPGIVALGTQSGPDCFVIAECSSLMDQMSAQRLVTALDPWAVRTYDAEAGPEEARTQRPWEPQ